MNTVFNILYVYGYGSSPNSTTVKTLRKNLPSDKFNVVCMPYGQEDPELAIETLNNIIKVCNIDLVIGSSLGGFLTLNLRNIPKIVINPCLHPENELEHLKKTDHHDAVPQEIIDAYKDFCSKHDTWENFDLKEKLTTIVLLGTKDELFGLKFKDELYEHVGGVHMVDQMHSSQEKDVINNIIPVINAWVDANNNLKNNTYDHREV